MTARRIAGVLAAVALVAVALWMLQRPPPERARRGGKAADRAPSPREVAAGRTVAAGRGGGVAPRTTSVPGHGWVRGRVVDEDGGAVTEGQVTLWCLDEDGGVAQLRDGVLTLDEDGRFEGPGCRGVVCPRLHHSSQVPAESWSLRSGGEQELPTRALPRLWGQVVEPGGDPVAAATVVVSAPPDAADDPTAALPVVGTRTSSDIDGEFSLAVIERPPCDLCQQAQGACADEVLAVLDRVRITAQAPGWAPGSIVIAPDDAAEPDEPAVVQLQPAGAAISGTLVDVAGQPVARASVLARSESQPTEQHQVDAAQGVFAFEALGEGPFTVRAIADGRELLRRSGVEPGVTLELQLPDAARDVEAQVVDEQGGPWPGVQVQGGPFERQRSDSDGLVRAQRVVPGAYILRVRPPGARARAYDLVVPPLPPEARNPSPLRIVVASGA